jgi:hypothetical protein
MGTESTIAQQINRYLISTHGPLFSGGVHPPDKSTTTVDPAAHYFDI